MNAVLPDGRIDADIVVLGEAPSNEEVLDGFPFVGPAGRLLFNEILPRAGIRRDDCYVLNVHWETPPGRKWETIPAQHLGRYDHQVHDSIVAHPHKVIIAVGEHALDFLNQKTAIRQSSTAITKWRGSILHDHDWGCPIVPMIHPNAVLRAGGYEGDDDDEKTSRKANHYKALCVHDATRARKIVDNPQSMVNPTRNVLHIGNSTFEELCTELLRYKSQPSPISFDIETFAHTTTCIGLGTSATHSIVIPLTQIDRISSRERADLVKIVSDVLDGPNPKIGQHLDYDVQHLARIGIPVRNVWLDTAVAHSILHPEIPHDLGTLTSLYTLQPYFKDMREDSKEVDTIEYDDRLWDYNGLDCCVTWEIGMKLAEELENA